MQVVVDRVLDATQVGVFGAIGPVGIVTVGHRVYLTVRDGAVVAVIGICCCREGGEGGC